MKITKRTISVVLLLALMLNPFTTIDINAAKKSKPKLSKTKISIYTDSSKTI